MEKRRLATKIKLNEIAAQATRLMEYAPASAVRTRIRKHRSLKGSGNGRRCAVCFEDKPEAAFTRRQWASVRKKDRTCMACTANMCITKSCQRCRRDRTQSFFTADQWQLPDDSLARTCYDCNVKQCSTCFESKGQREFDRRSWQLEDKDAERVCLACSNGDKQRGWWKCANRRCKLRKPLHAFSLTRAKHGPTVKGGSRQCNACVKRCGRWQPLPAYRPLLREGICEPHEYAETILVVSSDDDAVAGDMSGSEYMYR